MTKSPLLISNVYSWLAFVSLKYFATKLIFFAVRIFHNCSASSLD